MKINREKTCFVRGVASMAQLLDDLPQIAFAGRSNVGKSSLMNALLGRKNLVKTSSIPGKTRQLNFFLVDQLFYFVDLPGFGYARISKEERVRISKLIENYLRHSTQLRGLLYLIDLRTGGTELDIEMVQTLASSGVPMLLVATKGDKLKRSEQNRALQQIQNRFQLDEPPHWVSSSSGRGVDELWSAIEELILP